MNKINDNIKNLIDKATLVLSEKLYNGDQMEDIISNIFNLSPNERDYALSQLEIVAKKNHKARSYKKHLKEYKAQLHTARLKGKLTGKVNLTSYPAGYENLLSCYECGDYIVDDNGISSTRFSENLVNSNSISKKICFQPIVILELQRSVDSANEMVKLAYYNGFQWEIVTVSRETISSYTKIISLANNGLDITSINCKNMVEYLRCLLEKNQDKILQTRVASHFGWYDDEFVPYSNNIKIDNTNEFGKIANALVIHGDYETWYSHCIPLRKNVIIRLVMSASFAAPLVGKLNILPFIVHLWGKSGIGKTVALNLAASIWGKPDKELVRSLNATAFGIIEFVCMLNSLPCILDELQSVKNKTDSFNQLIMQITEGKSKIQGAKDGGLKAAKSWATTFIFSGEENIVKDNAGGGSTNRVVSIEIEKQLFPNCGDTIQVIRENYGFAGEKFIKGILQEEDLYGQLKKYQTDLLKQTNSTEKQCLAMAVLLLADSLAVKYIFHNERNLTIDDVKEFLTSKADIDIAERGYKFLMDQIASNIHRFRDNNTEIWGFEQGGCIMMIQTQLKSLLSKNGFDFDAVKRTWADRGYILPNSQNRFAHYTSHLGSPKCYYIKIPVDNDYMNIPNNKEWDDIGNGD